MQKIIFLDVDGVLVSTHQKKYSGSIQVRDQYGLLFDGFAVDNLETLCRDTGAKVVISSTWRLDRMPDWNQKKGHRQMVRLFRDRCVDVDVVGVTTDVAKLIDSGPLAGLLWEAAERGHEIQEYLDTHPEITHYVILDDHADMLVTQQAHFVQTKASEGFTWVARKNALRALDIPIATAS